MIYIFIGKISDTRKSINTEKNSRNCEIKNFMKSAITKVFHFKIIPVMTVDVFNIVIHGNEYRKKGFCFFNIPSIHGRHGSLKEERSGTSPHRMSPDIIPMPNMSKYSSSSIVLKSRIIEKFSYIFTKIFSLSYIESSFRMSIDMFETLGFYQIHDSS